MTSTERGTWSLSLDQAEWVPTSTRVFGRPSVGGGRRGRCGRGGFCVPEIVGGLSLVALGLGKEMVVGAGQAGEVEIGVDDSPGGKDKGEEEDEERFLTTQDNRFAGAKRKKKRRPASFDFITTSAPWTRVDLA